MIFHTASKYKNKIMASVLVALFVFLQCAVAYAAPENPFAGTGGQNSSQYGGGGNVSSDLYGGGQPTDMTLYGGSNNPGAGKVTTQGPPNGVSFECAPWDLSCVFRMLLYGIFSFVGWIMAAAASIFAWIMKPTYFRILDNQGIKDIWYMVRDFLNMFFILILLFSAFGTIFQVDKWNIKNIWQKLLISALLVNFSFPIARFFIDVSNVAMYYFLNNMFTGNVNDGSGIFANIANFTQVQNIIAPGGVDFFKDETKQIEYLIGAIVFVFILGMTLGVLAILFVFRLIALIILVMFSPIGFVANVIPSTAKYAGKWWDALLRYSFFGPFMTFMLAVSIQIMRVFGESTLGSSSLQSAASGNTIGGNNAKYVEALAFYSIPIIILWVSMGIGQSMGIEGAGWAVKKAKTTGDWMRKNLFGARLVTRAVGIDGGVKKGWESFKKDGKLGGKKILGPLYGGSQAQQQSEERIGAWISGGGKGLQNTKYNQDATKVKEASEKKDMGNMTEKDLRDLADKPGAKQHDRAAALLELAARGKADAKDVDRVKKDFGDNSKVFNQLRNKVKSYDPVAAFATDVSSVIDPATGKSTPVVNTIDEDRLREHVSSNQFDHKKLNETSLKNEVFVKMMFDEGALGGKEIKDINDKTGKYGKNLGDSIKRVMDDNPAAYTDHNNDVHKNIQLAFLASQGKLHDSANAQMEEKIFEKISKDNSKKLERAFIERNDNWKKMIEHASNTGKLIEAMGTVDSEDTARIFVEKVKGLKGNAAEFAALSPSMQGKIEALAKAFRRHPVLSRFN